MPVINASSLANGNLKGADYGATVSLILDHSEPGHGPKLHRHPYDETWVVQDGNLTFQAGGGTVPGGTWRHHHRAAGRAAQVHQQRSRALEPGVHSRQSDDGHRVARVRGDEPG